MDGGAMMVVTTMRAVLRSDEASGGQPVARQVHLLHTEGLLVDGQRQPQRASVGDTVPAEVRSLDAHLVRLQCVQNGSHSCVSRIVVVELKVCPKHRRPLPCSSGILPAVCPQHLVQVLCERRGASGAKLEAAQLRVHDAGVPRHARHALREQRPRRRIDLEDPLDGWLLIGLHRSHTHSRLPLVRRDLVVFAANLHRLRHLLLKIFLDDFGIARLVRKALVHPTLLLRALSRHAKLRRRRPAAAVA
mmetsp:Transcript_79058/g.226654  ORF Transcript_79058/g.226654 Transcript_79058/m.226654 type:complete len:247 (-) Transcript_79058:57-797(-)